jgi:hydrogenase maturation factor/predicted fused transcriptional regulator/phosphomethylpyrimidine kinase
MEQRERIELAGSLLLALEQLEACQEFAALVPEVRINFVYGPVAPQSAAEVMAIEGRITVVNGHPRAAGKPKLGASSHMARVLVELGKYDASVRAAINFRCTPELVAWLETYCRDRQWLLSPIHREQEPEDIRVPEGASMPWKIKTAVENAGGQVPKLFYERGAAGKEDLTVLVGRDPLEVAEQVCEIARLYGQSQATSAKIGKVAPETLTEMLRSRLGHPDATVVVPPQAGVDAGVIDLGADQVLVVAEDPIFTIPGQSPEMFGWYTVHIGASDVAVMGVKPRYMTYSLLLPPQTPDSEVRAIVTAIHTAAAELDIAIVGGHTGHYPGLSAPVVGGVTVFATAPKTGYVTAAGARPGDEVLLTKGPAIETTGILASLREAELLARYPANQVAEAKALCKQMTVVQDALLAMQAGGVSAMHDATEGGVMGGLCEMAQASGVGLDIEEAAMVMPDAVKLVCEAFDLDPLLAIAEGSLLITCQPESSQAILERLAGAGIAASVIGRVTDDPSRRIIRRKTGETQPLAVPEQDPFWPVFFAGLAKP